MLKCGSQLLVQSRPISQRHIPLLDLQAAHTHIREEVLAEITRVVDSQKFILGEDVEKLEDKLAEYCRVRFAIACASGSDALLLALMALEIKPGDEVLTTPYTFFATAAAITRLGAVPVFVDIEPETFNMDMRLAVRMLRERPNIRAVIPVHLFGGCADMDPLIEAAAERSIPVIEDAAQAIGAEYKDRRAGAMGDLGCFSFFPSKNLGGYGDGGMLTTTNPKLASRLRALRVHGSARKYFHDWVGINSRLDTLQAAVLRVKLRHLDHWTNGRRMNAEHYRAVLGSMNLPIAIPREAAYQTRHIYNQFVICGPDRDGLQAHLARNGVGTEIYYPLPLHLQACFADLGYRRGNFPVSESIAAESLALPVHSELPPEDLEYVCKTVAAFYG